MKPDLKKALAPWIKRIDQSQALTLRAVKALESIARDVRWQRLRLDQNDRRFAREAAARTARYKRAQKKGGAR